MAASESQVVRVLTDAIAAGHIPYGVVCATNSDRSFNIEYAVGPHTFSPRHDTPSEADRLTHASPSTESSRANGDDDGTIGVDALFLLASQTKLMTSIAALQLIERGLVAFDDDISKYIPELAAAPILKGYDATTDEPILETRTTPLTLRHLLTHSSGCTYDATSPDLLRYRKDLGQKTGTGSTIAARFGYPLIFEPGTAFQYGTSMDWAGKVIEAVSGQTLQEYMREHIWTPLGISTDEITFFADRHAHLAAQIPTVVKRGPDDDLVPVTSPNINVGAEDGFGGHGAYGRMNAYMKILHSILADDGRLLSSATNKMLFTSQINDTLRQSLNKTMAGPVGMLFIGEFDEEVDFDWAAGNLIIPRGDVDRRKKGSISWGGMYNTFWLIDREADLALTFGTHVLPPGDPAVARVISNVERAIYREANVDF